MNTGINILCYKSKTLSNGAHPLMIRVCKDGKKKYISLGVSVLPQFWDFEKNKPKRNCPNKAQIDRLIADKSREYADQILDFKADNKQFTAKSLISTVNKPTVSRTVGDTFLSNIKSLKEQKRTGYAMSHLEAYNSLVKFNGHLDIYFAIPPETPTLPQSPHLDNSLAFRIFVYGFKGVRRWTI